MRKKIIIGIILIIFAILVATLLYLFSVKQEDNLKDESASSNLNAQTTVLPLQDNEKELPLFDLFSSDNMTKYLAKHQYVHKPDIIKDDIEYKKGKKATFSRPEDRGEDYAGFSSRQLLDKLKNGDKIEQRKAANVLWERFGSKADLLGDKEKSMIADRTKEYLSGIKTDFEENTMQIQRLWHLAVPALLANVTHEDVSISENVASLLSVMKTPQILDELIAASNETESMADIGKYIFALEYMKINNPYFVESRTRMSDSECESYFNEKITPQITLLKQRLQNIKQMSGHGK